jgi:hypothetical protein
MKTVSNQVETARRSKFDYDPTRHYVLVQKPDAHWDGPQFDRLMDEVDATGEDAYRIEADGDKGAEARRVTGHRQLVMLSCSKEHIDEKIRTAAKASNTNALSLKSSPDFDEKLEFRAAISIDDIPSKL